MPAKKVNATRMELLRLKRRTLLARKGHKLLKDKLDGLVQRLMATARDYEKLGVGLEERLSDIFGRLIIASALTTPQSMEEAVSSSKCQAGLEITVRNIMGVKIPGYALKVSGELPGYRFDNTPAELDLALADFRALLSDLVKLAEYNKTILLIASQVVEIKRRVNALEYVLIPELDAAVRFIRLKLSEMERSATVALMKIKELVRG